MYANLKGAVDEYKFKAPSQRLFPLFEAISNSLQSIYLSKNTPGKIVVVIERDQSQTSLKLQEKVINPIKNIIVTDNGEGFTDKNFNSFKSLYTPLKKDQFGCKGIGRLVWFKTFDKIEVSSIYKDGNSYKKREFYQTLNDDLPQSQEPVEINDQKSETKILLLNAKEGFKEHLKIKPETIKREIIQHFFPHLLLFENCPTIIVKDGTDTETIDSSSLPNSELFSFQIGNEKFDIRHIKNAHSDEKKHRIYYCANSRVVKPEEIENFTKKKLQDDDSAFFYEGYRSSIFYLCLNW